MPFYSFQFNFLLKYLLSFIVSCKTFERWSLISDSLESDIFGFARPNLEFFGSMIVAHIICRFYTWYIFEGKKIPLLAFSFFTAFQKTRAIQWFGINSIFTALRISECLSAYLKYTSNYPNIYSWHVFVLFIKNNACHCIKKLPSIYSYPLYSSID